MARDFATYLRSEVQRISKRESLTRDKSFLFWFGTMILELSQDEAREAISIEGANDKSIDLFWIDEDEGRVVLAQSQYSPQCRARPKVGKLAKLESSLNWLADPQSLVQDGRPDLAQCAEDYNRAVKDGYGVELWFVYAGPKCSNIEKHIAVYNQNPENLSRRRAFRHYYLDMLRTSWEELEGKSTRIPSETVRVLSSNTLSISGAFGEALVATIPADEIVRLYREYGERLFDRNVRLFLGVRKGTVNAGIAETLRKQSDRGNFWAYNNGITFICDECHDTQQHGVLIKNFSIVNGCQTAASLAQAPPTAIADAAVLGRFIAASSEIVDDVIRFTNSQNPIRTWDIASQDRTQRRLKEGFQGLNRPFIYMTRRGARPKKELAKYREGGRLRLIRIDLMGQYAAAFRGKPVLAYKHKAFIFSQEHDAVFPPDVQVEEALFQWVCGEACRESVQAGIAHKKEGDEVRILRKGGTLFVTAAASRILADRNGATYLTRASEDRILSQGTRTRLRKYADYARDAYVQAVIDQSSLLEKEELATLIRQPAFFDKVLDRIMRAYGQSKLAEKWVREALPVLRLSNT